MLSLLSRIVSGGDSEDRPIKKEDYANLSSPDSSSITEDTDEEFVSSSMPVINIDQTELAQEALDADKGSSHASLEQIDSSEDVKDDSALDEKIEKEVPVVIPSRDVCQRIVELIEYYLSDENLVKDMFLLKHVTKHREGYISLKLLTSYKKVKRLTKDWRVVAYSLKPSKALELNSDETKVRRRSSLPQELEEDTRQFRTLLATHISQERANMNQLAEFFGKFGDIISLQVHKPGGRTLNEVKQAERQHPGVANTVCAMVEYEKVHCARQALRFINNNHDESKMKVIELQRKKQENLLGVQARADAESAYYSNSDLSDPPSPIYRGRPPLQMLKTASSSLASSPSASPITKRRLGAMNSSPESSPPSSNSCHHGPPSPCSSPESHPPSRALTSYDQYSVFQRYEVPGSLPLPRRQFPRQIPKSKHDSQKARGCRLPNTTLDSMPMPLSPWLRRRAFALRNENASLNSTPSSSPILRRRMDSKAMVPDNVTRLPRGPDGTKGFAMRRSTLIQAKA